ncbi:MAG: hypothetical protein JO057_25740 [Chloroflexi bacterium]|nr:hypothetical protein [Chloroflexota bacterium]
MDVFAVAAVTGVACLAMAGVVALTRPIERWRTIAMRLTTLGGILIVVGLILWVIQGNLIR